MTDSLYRRLGGAEGIAAIVDEAIDRHATHPLLASRFRGRDLPQVKALSLRFLGDRTRDSPPGTPDGDAAAHAGMHFGHHELAAVIDDVAAAMRALGIGRAEVDEVLGLLRETTREASHGPR